MADRTYKKEDEGWRGRFEHELRRLATLPEGSDSWTAHKPSDSVIWRAKNVADRFWREVARDHISEQIVAATSEGGLQIKWSRPGRELSVFVYPDPNQSVEFLFVRRDQPMKKSGDLEPDQYETVIGLFEK
jgi:hypothetical protein